MRITALVLFAQLFLGTIAFPQSRVQFSLDTVMHRIDNMHLTLNRINDFQEQGFDTRRVEQQLPGIRENLQVIEVNISPDNNVPDIKNLQLFAIMLNTIRQQLEEWRTSLFRFNNDLINMNAEIGAFTRDSVIRQLVKDSVYRKMYTDEVRTLEQKWVAAAKATQSNLARINRLQSAVSEEYFQTVDLRNKVIIMKRDLTARLLSKEFGYLWQPGNGIDSGAQAAQMAVRTYRGQRGLMAYYIRTNWDNYLLVLAIGLLFFYWVWHNFRILRRTHGTQISVSPSDNRVSIRQAADPQNASQPAGDGRNPDRPDLYLHYLHPLPILSSLAVILNIVPFFDLDAPAIYIQLVQGLLLLVLSMMFWRRWTRRYFGHWILLALLFVLFSATGALLVPFMNIRIFLLGLNILSATLGYKAAKRITKVVCFPRIVKIVAVVYLVLNLLAILCNLFGRLSLAKFFSSSAIFGLVQIVGLSVFIECLLETLSLQGAVARAGNVTGKSAFVFDKMQKGAFRALLVFSIFTWVVVFAINMNIYDPLYLKLTRLLNATKTFGSISFRLGNLFIFVIIVYLSNVLQKYVGYLFGATDEHAMPAGGKKGSRLVMTRLILIICGFLLAIGASGLPIDKITIVLGALGVGIGLGLQTIVNSLVSGIILIFERPFQIGDYIELNGKKGIVRDIGIRSSRLVTEEGTEIIMPNGDLLAGEVINWTVRNNQVRIEVPLTVEAGHPFEDIVAIVHEALDGHKDLSGENKPRILLTTATEKSTGFTVSVWVANISQIQTIKSEVLSLLYQKFREKGIRIA
ncbi:MAG: mechanosensitive ion channel [Bacteroidota bacterium]|nr:mechanosensitive ion channel [Bacteroidota bacterium]